MPISAILANLSTCADRFIGDTDSKAAIKLQGLTVLKSILCAYMAFHHGENYAHISFYKYVDITLYPMLEKNALTIISIVVSFSFFLINIRHNYKCKTTNIKFKNNFLQMSFDLYIQFHLLLSIKSQTKIVLIY